MQIRTESFIDTQIDLFTQIKQKLTPKIELASLNIVSSLLNEGKVICCGNSTAALCSQYFSSKLLNRFDQQRPSLPAISLTTDTATLTGICIDYDFSEIYSRQIRALGNNKDILLAISYDDRLTSILQAINAAHDREMCVIALTATHSDINTLLLPDDIEICIPTQNMVYLQQAYFLIIDCLCNLIDHQLFGSDS